jgi:hypothetical protein
MFWDNGGTMLFKHPVTYINKIDNFSKINNYVIEQGLPMLDKLDNKLGKLE